MTEINMNIQFFKPAKLLLSMCFCFTFFSSISAIAQDAQNEREMLMRLDVHESDYFSYRVTLNTTAKRYYPHVDAPNEYHRELTYFISEHIGKIGTDGIVTLNANFDSITIYTKSGQAETRFNSQSHANTESMDLNNPELRGTTMLLNKPFTFRMTLDGDYIDHGGWEQWTTMIDTASFFSDAKKYAWEEYMNDDFLRSELLTSAGFTYNKRYYDLEDWTQPITQLIFKTPVLDSTHFHIEIPKSHALIVAYAAGNLYGVPGKTKIYEHGYLYPSTIDSLSGKSRDTISFAKQGYTLFHSRASDINMLCHEQDGKTPFDENIHETMEVKLLYVEQH